MGLKDKVAIVTGAGSEIVRASALKMAEQGARIVLMALKGESIERLAKKIISEGGDAVVIAVDVADSARIAQTVKEAASHWRRLDIVFSNAGINGAVAPIENLSTADWDKTLTTKLKSTFLFVKSAIPFMKEKGGGLIITSSINGNRVYSNIGMSAYATSKAGQVAFMKKWPL